MGVITFNGVSSDSLGIWISEPPSYTAPEKDFDSYHVPGKSGDVIVFHGSYKNSKRTYNISKGSYDGDFADITKVIMQWLTAPVNYAKLSDSYSPDYFQYAFYEGSTDIENVLKQAGRATLEFNCKPYRYLVSGDSPMDQIVQNGTEEERTISNPTQNTASPLIEVKLRSGATTDMVYWGSKTITITAAEGVDTYLIDSEIQDCFYDTVNLNSKVTFSDGEFPVLAPGDTVIGMTSGVEYVRVLKARWYVI